MNILSLSKGICEHGGGVLFVTHIVFLLVVVVDARNSKICEPADAFVGEYGGRSKDVCLNGLQGDAGVFPSHLDLWRK